ncbi:uncharacterized membrane protein YhaH (DUF805 family) [Microbacteriaceae bacterium SG_E_30_P1]|uniref:Uncharacterized membrane protein YhaH (DUF805 family) n=1 Tax=Antiquaquibacter oligotrophicus TaxID=2880260 RepID=A0ABT6KMR4_9MICO|nr:DUF805 domain-containing protein [Antiquaquibacter oligotrophicus]MDH6180422.1 uncharacterized membrane protein YhaH (DUF805 family) [Antiquaquibacter oligotrophicus]UDF13840.1 DUF805 domain-containing protein [Antiquaquibacter oligotrophicus]
MTDTALSQPLYGASFGQAVSRFFKKYATVSGRASRSEYWWAALFNVLVSAVFAIILVIVLSTTGEQTSTGVRGTGPEIAVLVVWGIVVLGLIIPHIAVTVRRLHDGNFTGWLYLLNLIPSVGGIIVFILALLPSNPEGAKYDRAAGI